MRAERVYYVFFLLKIGALELYLTWKKWLEYSDYMKQYDIWKIRVEDFYIPMTIYKLETLASKFNS